MAKTLEASTNYKMSLDQLKSLVMLAFTTNSDGHLDLDLSGGGGGGGSTSYMFMAIPVDTAWDWVDYDPPSKPTTIILKSGGSGGTTVATFTVTYSGDFVETVAKT